MVTRVLIAGPTGVGKTACSLAVARAWKIPVISADARQCYRLMDIGTDKITPDEHPDVPHYNISIFDPDERDTVGRFYERVQKWENKLLRDFPFVLYTGGSTLYLESLIRPLDEVPETDREIMRTLQAEYERNGINELYEQLKEADPEYAVSMDGMNPQRILRSLAVYRQTGKPFSSYHRQKPPDSPKSVLVFVLTAPRNLLYRRINDRVDEMIRKGLIDEVKMLMEKGYDFHENALKTVGYTEIHNYLHGQYDLPEAIRLIKRNTRRYAKRQLTWFRRWKGALWLDVDESGIERPAERIVRRISEVVAKRKIC